MCSHLSRSGVGRPGAPGFAPQPACRRLRCPLAPLLLARATRIWTSMARSLRCAASVGLVGRPAASDGAGRARGDLRDRRRARGRDLQPSSHGVMHRSHDAWLHVVRERQRSTAASASTSWLLRSTSGDGVDSERVIAIVAKRSRARRGPRDWVPSEGIVPRPAQLLLLLGEHPGRLDRQIVSSMAGIPS